MGVITISRIVIGLCGFVLIITWYRRRQQMKAERLQGELEERRRRRILPEEE